MQDFLDFNKHVWSTVRVCNLPESWPRRLHTLVLSRFRLIRLSWSSRWLRGMS